MSQTIDSMFFSDLERKTIFYIVRHGESLANAQNRIQGRHDIVLNDAGRLQAASLGRWFKGRPVSRVLHSPLKRAAETAAIIASEAGFPELIVEPSLIEIDTGKFSGLALDEAAERYPEDYAGFRERSWEGVAGAERETDLSARASSAWARLKAEAMESGGDVLAVSHGGMIQWLFRATFGASAWMPLVSTGNCGVFELLVEPNGLGKPAYMLWKSVNATPGDSLPRVKPVF